MQNILIINPFGIGDVLFTTPLVRALKEGIKPAPRITFVCNARTYPIIAANPCIDRVIVFDRGDYRMLWRADKAACVKNLLAFVADIIKSGFDCVFDISLSRQFSFLSAIARVPVRIGFDYKGRGTFLTHRMVLEGFSGKPIPDYYLSLSRLAGVETAAGGLLEFPLTQGSAREADALWASHGITGNDLLVGIVPGGGDSWGSDAGLKRWAPEKFAEAAGRLVAERRAIPVIFGSNGEAELCDSVQQMIAGKSVVATGLSLGGFAAAMKRCRVVICNDGGPLHIAVSQGVKTVSIFGPVDPLVYGPYPGTDRHAVITAAVPCRPCYRNFRYEKCGNRRCLGEISPDAVCDAAIRLLH